MKLPLEKVYIQIDSISILVEKLINQLNQLNNQHIKYTTLKCKHDSKYIVCFKNDEK